MFCPNCGTQNADTATTCSKCGFNLKGAAAPKFKGTMLMVNAPANVPRVANPAGEPQKPAAAMPSKLKGTMLGVAPPPAGAAPAPVPAHAPAPAAAPAPVQPVAEPAPQPVAVPPPPFGMPGPGAPTFGGPGHAPSPAAHAQAFNPGGPGAPADPLGGTVVAGSAPGFPAAPAGAAGPTTPYGSMAADIPAPPGFGQPAAPPYQPGVPAFGGPSPVGTPGPVGGFGGQDHAVMGAGVALQPMGGAAAIQPMAGASVAGPMGAHGPIGKERNWLVTLIVGSLLCGVGYLWFFWNMLNELKAFRQKDDFNPFYVFLPILNLLLLFELPEKVLDAKRMAGVANPTVASGIMYLFLSWYFLPNDLNEIWQAASRGQPR